MFLLRARAPERYGKWRDAMQAHRVHPNGAARVFGHALAAMAEDGRADIAGKPRPQRAPLRTVWLIDDPAGLLRMEEEEAAATRRDADWWTYLHTFDAQTGAGLFDPDLPPTPIISAT